MAVMAAGMHLAGHGRFIGPLRQFRHGERIHVGAQPDPACAVAELQRADHAGAAEAAMHRDAGFLEKRRDDAAGALLLETEFGMGMQVAAQGGQKRQIVA